MTRQEIEADVYSLETTGQWVDGIIPEWANAKAMELHCSPTSPAVIQFGLCEIIRLLKDELTAVKDKLEINFAARLGNDW